MVTCRQCREAVSARFDGEDSGAAEEAVRRVLDDERGGGAPLGLRIGLNTGTVVAGGPARVPPPPPAPPPAPPPPAAPPPPPRPPPVPEALTGAVDRRSRGNNPRRRTPEAMAVGPRGPWPRLGVGGRHCLGHR